jgi:ABC-2 type transport system permease protein
LRQAARTIGALCVGTALFFYLVLYSSSSFVAQAGTTTPWLRDPPRFVRALLGGSTGFFDASGWLASGMTHPITLALFTAAALTIAVAGVAGEIERGTIDFVLTRPIPRRSYLTSVAAASLVVVTAVQLSGLATTLLARYVVDGVDQLAVGDVARVFAGSWLLFAAVSLVAVLISATVSLRGRALALSSGFVLISYFANFTALLVDKLYGLRLASVFHYVQPAVLVTGRGVGDLVVPAVLGAVALALALVRFGRRDIVR